MRSVPPSCGLFCHSCITVVPFCAAMLPSVSPRRTMYVFSGCGTTMVCPGVSRYGSCSSFCWMRNGRGILCSCAMRYSESPGRTTWITIEKPPFFLHFMQGKGGFVNGEWRIRVSHKDSNILHSQFSITAYSKIAEPMETISAVSRPATPIARPEIAPSVSPSSMAREVPTA